MGPECHLGVGQVSGRELWLGLRAVFFFSIRFPEVFADSIHSYHLIYCVRRSNVAFLMERTHPRQHD